jgi:alkylated DNA repair dioxygenase AlkB
MPVIRGIHHVPGLDLHGDFVTERQEADIVMRALVPARGAVRPARSSPIGSERARVERYGMTVYTTGNVSSEIPVYLRELCQRIHADGITKELPNSVSINEYKKGQGLVSHVDNPDGGDEICILGLAGDAQMKMECIDHDAHHHVEFTFPRRGLLVMTGMARWFYTHGVLPLAQNRISLVFRTSSSVVA